MFSFSKIVLLAVTAAAQVSILSGMIVLDSLPLYLGDTVRLKVEPVDPRDMFRGDYVILGYDFSRYQLDKIQGLKDANEVASHDGEEVFINFRSAGKDKYMAVKDVSVDRPASGTYIRGTLNGWNSIDAGIGAYYVQEGQGRRIEEAIRSKQTVYADVAVWHGTARLKEVIVEP